MFSLKSIVLIAAAFISAECSAPAVVAPAAVGYAHAVPQNVPPYASQVNVFNRALSAPYLTAPYAAPLAAPLAAPVAAPLAAAVPAPVAAPLAAPVPAQYAAPFTSYAARIAPAPYASYVAAPYAAAPYAFPGPFAPTAYGAAYPYGAPLVRGAFGVAPAFVR